MSLSAVTAKRCVCSHSESLHVWLPHRGRREGCNVTGCGCRCFTDAAITPVAKPVVTAIEQQFAAARTAKRSPAPPPPDSSPGRIQRCTTCGTKGHNARSCPQRAKPENVPVSRAVPPPPPTVEPPRLSVVHPDLLPESDEIDRLIHQRAEAVERLSAERASLRARLERVEEQLRQLSAFTPATT
jgi:hypothetical protein